MTGTGAAFCQGTGAGFIQGAGAARGCATEAYGDGLWFSSDYPAPADSLDKDIYLVNFPTSLTVISSFHPTNYDNVHDVTHDDTDFMLTHLNGSNAEWYKLSGQITSTVLASYTSWTGTNELYAHSYEETGDLSCAGNTSGWVELYDDYTGTLITSANMATVSGAAESAYGAEFSASDFFWSNIIAGNFFHALTSGHFTATVIASIVYTVPPSSTNPTSKPEGTAHDGTDAVIDIQGVSGSPPVSVYELHQLSGIAATETILSSHGYLFSFYPFWLAWGSYSTRYV